MFWFPKPEAGSDELISVRTIPGDVLVRLDSSGTPLTMALDYEESTSFRAIERMTRNGPL
jgi:hypothetical protein